MAGNDDDAHNPFGTPARPMKIEDPFDKRHRKPNGAPADPFSPSPGDADLDTDDDLREGDDAPGTRDA